MEGSTSNLFHTERRLVSSTYSIGETPVAYPVSPGKGQGKMKGTAAVSLGTRLGNVLQMPEHLHWQHWQHSLPFVRPYLTALKPHAKLLEGQKQ